jgi:hypothetical protein
MSPLIRSLHDYDSMLQHTQEFFYSAHSIYRRNALALMSSDIACRSEVTCTNIYQHSSIAACISSRYGNDFLYFCPYVKQTVFRKGNGIRYPPQEQEQKHASLTTENGWLR